MQKKKIDKNKIIIHIDRFASCNQLTPLQISKQCAKLKVIELWIHNNLTTNTFLSL